MNNRSNRERKSIYSIDEIRKEIDVNSIEKKKDAFVCIDGDLIKRNSKRYRTFFTKGCDCSRCGIKGKFFAKERNINCERYHLELYALDSNGNEVMMTKGGRDSDGGYLPLCENCRREVQKEKTRK